MAKNRQNSPHFSYPIALPVEYELLDHNWNAGRGWTLSISSEIVRFKCNQSLPVERKIRLVLSWPARLPDGTALNLWITGETRSSEFQEVAVRLGTYEFRTRRGLEHGRMRDQVAAARIEPLRVANTLIGVS